MKPLSRSCSLATWHTESLFVIFSRKPILPRAEFHVRASIGYQDVNQVLENFFTNLHPVHKQMCKALRCTYIGGMQRHGPQLTSQSFLMDYAIIMAIG